MNLQNRAREVLRRRGVVAWALYDFGNSAFATVVIAGFFPIFYTSLSAELTARDSQFWFNLTIALASLSVALCAPWLGAAADRGAARRKFLAAFAGLGILMSAALAWTPFGLWQLALLFYALGTIGFYGANIFYDATLLEVAGEQELDLVSGYGYALGYLGGGVLLAVNVLLVTNPRWFGLPDAGAAVAAAFISAAAWWGIFTIPILFAGRARGSCRRPVATPPRRAPQTRRASWSQVAQTFATIRAAQTPRRFLIAYFLYIDGVGTIFKVAVFFGARILGLPQTSLIIALLLTQFVAFPAALLFGWLGGRVGARNMILIGISVYCAVILYAWAWLDSAADFYGLAVAIGLVQGGVQSLSRSLYARFVPKNHSAEFFGFFNMVGKFAAILGPLLLAATPFIIPAASARDSILALLPLFILGGGLLWKVDAAAGAADMQRGTQT